MLSPSAKVGLMVILTALALVGVYYFLTSAGLKAQSYPINVTFRNAQGLERGAPVRMAGVRVGQVEAVDLLQAPGKPTSAVAHLLINRKFTVGTGYVYTIGTVGLLGQPYIEIVPKPKMGRELRPNDTVSGREAVEVADLVPQAQMLLKNLNSAAVSANKILSDQETFARIRRTAANLESATARADQLVASFQDITNENRGQINSTLSSFAEAAKNLNQTMADLDKLVGKPELREDLAATLGNARNASERMVKIAGDIQALTGDQQFTGNIKATAAEARATMENTRVVATEANALIKKLDKAISGVQAPKIRLKLGISNPFLHPQINVLGGTKEGDLRIDANFLVPQPEGRSILFGIRGVTESNKFNLEFGNRFRRDLNLRYGLWASKLGVGVDYVPPGRYSLETNFFGTSNPEFDLYNRYQFMGPYGAILGMEQIGSGNRIVGGLSYRR